MSMEYASMEASTTDIGVRENGINPGLFGSHEIQLFEPSNMQATVTGSPEELIAFAMRLMEAVRDEWPLMTQVAVRNRAKWGKYAGKDKG